MPDNSTDLAAQFAALSPEPGPLDEPCPACLVASSRNCVDYPLDQRPREGSVHKRRHDTYLARIAEWEERRLNFAATMTALGSVTQERLDAVLDEYPALNANGYGSPRGYDYDTVAGRERLRELLGEVRHCVAWLATQKWQKRLSKRSASSYALKHAAERVGEVGYVCNGALIAAALIVGVPIRLDDLNPRIGIAL